MPSRHQAGAAPAEGRTRILDRAIIGGRRFLVGLSASRAMSCGAGTWLTALLFAATGIYGLERGGHMPTAIETVRDMGDAAANLAGFRIANVNLSGQNHVTPGDILATAGVKPTSSLVFLDAEGARTRLEELAWIKRATVQKLYPDRLDIQIVEREGFALWQKDGKINVIARDGTVIAPYSDDARYIRLPIVVGDGAEKSVVEIVEALSLVPGVRDQVRAAIRVADRRWTLKMRNGIDVRLPERGLVDALQQLAVLDKDKSLLSRDITIVDLRLPDRVSVRLSDAAYEARQAELKARAKAKKGSNT
ncbi:Cell division protein FtsQ [Starkeya nomas]|uniref:Cell division protein FtsQ n=2 Tax=Xanthobacteraceae TaxID=335928 RepID=A0A5S9PKL4_9HYPH|nr:MULTISPECIES: cell division protein FtsQ/DivIB [Xanthobacteraceae]TSJ60376.1 cell division protein FtsQ/DivIB [Ancylobacter moscoviensis]CAA0104673.1 Cell division protein FtsQ [Starkeya nomas]